MPIVLSHISALQYLNSGRKLNRQYQIAVHARSIASRPPQLSFDTAERLDIDFPIHALVANKSARRNSRKLLCHTWNRALPKGYILKLDEEIFCVSPEFAFLQLANEAPLLDLIKLGYELCGSYYVEGEIIHQCDPLTTVKKLASFIDKVKSFKGTEKAKRALRYILDDSASPMETSFAMLFFLPYKLGGYGIPRAKLNHRITSNAIDNWSHSYICDFYWPHSKFAVEYDSFQFHAEKTKLIKDSVKRSDLLASGIHAISVTCGELETRRSTDKIASSLAEHTKKRLRIIEPEFTYKNMLLREFLFGKPLKPR